MASLHKEKAPRAGWRLRYRDVAGRNRGIWLGAASKRSAEEIKRHVEELLRAKELNTRAADATEDWVADLTGALREKLAKQGLIASEHRSELTVECRTVGAYFDRYVSQRTDLKASTRNKYEQAVTWFTDYTGRERLLTDVTPGEIDRWRLWMIEKDLAQATANKHAKRIKKLFAEAVRDRLLRVSPAADQRIGGEVNRERDAYISREMAAAVLVECDTEWALIFGLCRFAGFRCPTEVLALRWQDVDWEENRLRVESVKTGLRFCPIFPEVRPLLDRAFEEAPEGATYCIRSYRGNEQNLRTQLHRLIKRAKLETWPKAFVNLRASCRTDLQERFPSHVVDNWLGHSSKVAETHYLQVTETHWQRAVEEVVAPAPAAKRGNGCGNAGGNGCGNTGGNIPADPEPSGAHKPAKSLRKSPLPMAADAVGAGVQYPRKGSNKAAVPQEKATPAGNVGTPVGTAGAKPVPGAEELLDLFRSLDPAARADLLAVARGLAAPKPNTGHARNR